MNDWPWRSRLQFRIWKVYPVVYFQFPIWIYVNSDIALFCQTPDLRSMMAKAWYQQQLPMADTDPRWSQHSFQIWWKDWPVITYQPHCHSCHFVYMKLMEEIGQSRLCSWDLIFFFLFCFHREKDVIRSLSLQLELSASPAQSTLEWSAQMVTPRLPTALQGSEIAGTHHEILYMCAGVLEIKGLWIQMETSRLKTTKHFHDFVLF